MKRWRLQRRRQRIASTAHGAIAPLARSPLPPASARAYDVEFVCLDIETSGLDPSTAELLSIGWVIVRQCRIPLETAVRRLVRPQREVGNSATIHGLTDGALAEGQSIDSVLAELLDVLAGRVLVVHHAGLDKRLLDRLSEEAFGTALPVPVLDTMALSHRLRSRQHHIDSGGALRLNALRDAYGLPRYSAHDCLVDALATAELLLALLQQHGAGGDTPVWRWLSA